MISQIQKIKFSDDEMVENNPLYNNIRANVTALVASKIDCYASNAKIS